MSRTDESGRDGLRAGLEELTADFEGNVDWSAGRNNYGDNEAWESAARHLRALLDDHPPTPAEGRCPDCGHGTADGRLACGPECDQGRTTPAEEPAEVAVEEREAAEVVCPCGHGLQSHTWAGCTAYVPPRIGGAGACCTKAPTEVILASDWLRDHDAALTAKAKAEAWDEGVDYCEDIAGVGYNSPGGPVDANPYRAARDRA